VRGRVGNNKQSKKRGTAKKEAQQTFLSSFITASISELAWRGLLESRFFFFSVCRGKRERKRKRKGDELRQITQYMMKKKIQREERVQTDQSSSS
jgi:hypothetical protein